MLLIIILFILEFLNNLLNLYIILEKKLELNGRKIGVRESENKSKQKNNKNQRSSREMQARREEGIED